MAAIGQVVKLGGGTYQEKEYEVLRTLMSADVPAACRTSNYFLATTVVR